jgi:hypothetical protein
MPEYYMMETLWSKGIVAQISTSNAVPAPTMSALFCFDSPAMTLTAPRYTPSRFLSS